MINHTHTEKNITKSVLRESCSKADETKWMKKYAHKKSFPGTIIYIKDVV
jgi:hypothetical protein